MAYYIFLENSPKVVYKIVQKSVINGPYDGSLNQNVYCIKAGPGFHKGEMASISDLSQIRNVSVDGAEDIVYQEFFDLKDRTTIMNSSPFDQAMPSTEALYKGMLWILDNAFTRPINYSNPDQTEEAELAEYKIEYLTKALVGQTGTLL